MLEASAERAEHHVPHTAKLTTRRLSVARVDIGLELDAGRGIAAEHVRPQNLLDDTRAGEVVHLLDIESDDQRVRRRATETMLEHVAILARAG